jgi:hypothetical protein
MKRTFIVGQAIIKGKKAKGMSIPKNSIYKSSTPVSAAIKGFNDICKKNKKKQFCNVVVSVKDVTHGGKFNGKEYNYQVERVHEPHTVKVAGKNVIFNYKTKAISLNAKTLGPCYRRSTKTSFSRK